MNKLTQTFEQITLDHSRFTDEDWLRDYKGLSLEEVLIRAVRERESEILAEFQELAHFQINQKSVRYPEYIEGINKAGEELEERVQQIRQRLEATL